MASTVSVPNLSAFSAAELQAMLTACKAELLARFTGRVNSGSSTGQQFAVTMYSTDELNRMVNAITAALGLDTQQQFVRPNFTVPLCGYGTPSGAFNSTGVPDVTTS